MGDEKPDHGSQESKNGNKPRSLDAVRIRGLVGCVRFYGANTLKGHAVPK